ncbi:hypothetical protein DM02DRAFT_613228 [Periconia macrospinosa]|uniref:Uncharacterized protein n=1 Tax=Periconia macrospinosa TaxID=97972 RepID=A0A2V1DUZ5_9PLEO|nr:hypothetical protein DM02DRAFT_613228 [Periconia macrospinosa]
MHLSTQSSTPIKAPSQAYKRRRISTSRKLQPPQKYLRYFHVHIPHDINSLYYHSHIHPYLYNSSSLKPIPTLFPPTQTPSNQNPKIKPSPPKKNNLKPVVGEKKNPSLLLGNTRPCHRGYTISAAVPYIHITDYRSTELCTVSKIPPIPQPLTRNTR